MLTGRLLGAACGWTLPLACEMMGCNWRVASFLLTIHRGFDFCPCEATRKTNFRLSRSSVNTSMSCCQISASSDAVTGFS